MPVKGTYCLCINVKKDQVIRVGALGELEFALGNYVYVGSALNSLYPRLDRHMKHSRGEHDVTHWHIDYLLKKVGVENVILCLSEEKNECNIASKVGEEYKVIKGFGSSDCNCTGHLYYSPFDFGSEIMRKLESTGMKPQLIVDSKDSGNQ